VTWRASIAARGCFRPAGRFTLLAPTGRWREKAGPPPYGRATATGGRHQISKTCQPDYTASCTGLTVGFFLTVLNLKISSFPYLYSTRTARPYPVECEMAHTFIARTKINKPSGKYFKNIADNRIYRYRGLKLPLQHTRNR